MRYWVSILTIAVVLLAIAFFNLYSSAMKFNDNSAGVLVSALGVMVTVLVGLQVYNAVEAKTMLNKVDKVKKALKVVKKEHQQKIESLGWLASALHGSIFSKEGFKNEPEYFLHCLDVVGCFIRSNADINSKPFEYSLEQLETTLNSIVARKNPAEIMLMGERKDFVREWYQIANRIIDTEIENLKELKERLALVYEKYIILTKDVKIEPQKSSSTPGPNTKSQHKKRLICTLINKLQRRVCGK